MKTLLTLTTAGTLAGLTASQAAIVLDGSYDADYGAALALQTNPTGFGDNNDATTDVANGSEINAIYANVSGGNLHVLVTGNLESNFNKLDMFIDSQTGGQNSIDNSVNNGGSNPDVDFDALESMAGLTFDSGFNADFFISTSNGNSPTETYMNYAELGGAGAFLGGGAGLTINGSNGINFALNNSNVGGVDGANVNDPSLPTTGMEFLIPLSTIGNPTGDISITAFINAGNHGFLSNQVAAGLPAATGNLGAPGSVNFANLAGDQFVTVTVPEPSSALLLGAAGLMVLQRRKRS